MVGIAVRRLGALKDVCESGQGRVRPGASAYSRVELGGGWCDGVMGQDWAGISAGSLSKIFVLVWLCKLLRGPERATG